MLAYKSLCPNGWTSRWDDQRGEFSRDPGDSSAERVKNHHLTTPTEAGNFPVKLDQ
jgi:hypothetical protein